MQIKLSTCCSPIIEMQIYQLSRIGNNKINETSVTEFLGIDLDKKLNFVNHITEMSMKVAKSIGFLYKINPFFPETILKTLYTSLILPYLYGVEAWHGTYQN